MSNYPYYFEWATGQSSPHQPSMERVIELSDDRPEYEFQFAALLALDDKMTIQICTQKREGYAPLYKAYEIRGNVGYFTYQMSTNIAALVDEIEAATPKPIGTFDDTARLAFWKSLQ